MTLIPQINLDKVLDVALHLSNYNAPIVPPSQEIPPAVYQYKNLEVTFWQYCPGEIREELDQTELVIAIAQFHTAFSSYRGKLKLFTQNYHKCCSLLDSDRLSPELSMTDRQFLLQVYEHLSASLHSFNYKCVPVHTEIHNGNVIWKGEKPFLIDFESCCRGPRELDFLFSERSLSVCPDINIDRKLVKVLANLKSFCVAVWCYLQLDRAPEVREAAEYHLNRLYGLYR